MTATTSSRLALGACRAVKATPVRPELVLSTAAGGAARLRLQAAEPWCTAMSLVLSVAAAPSWRRSPRPLMMLRLGQLRTRAMVRAGIRATACPTFCGLGQARTDHPPPKYLCTGRREDSLRSAVPSAAPWMKPWRVVTSRPGSSIARGSNGFPPPGQCVTSPCSLSVCAGARLWCSGPWPSRKPRCRRAQLRRFFSARRGGRTDAARRRARIRIGGYSRPPLAFWLGEITSGSPAIGSLVQAGAACVVIACWAVFALGRSIVGTGVRFFVLLMVGVAAFLSPGSNFGPAILAAPLSTLSLLTRRAVSEGRRGSGSCSRSFSGCSLLQLRRADPVAVVIVSHARDRPRRSARSIRSRRSRYCFCASWCFRTHSLSGERSLVMEGIEEGVASAGRLSPGLGSVSLVVLTHLGLACARDSGERLAHAVRATCAGDCRRIHA